MEPRLALVFLAAMVLTMLLARLFPVTVWPDTRSPLGSGTDFTFVDDAGVCYKYEKVEC